MNLSDEKQNLWGELIHGDAEFFFERIQSDKFPGITDCHIFTSPPYNRGVKYADGVSDNRRMALWHSIINGVLGDFFAFFGTIPVSAWIQLDDKAYDEMLMSERFCRYHRQKFVWVKSMTPEDGSPSWGHFRPRPGDIPHNAWEWVIRIDDPDRPRPKFDRRAEVLGVAPIDQRNVKRFASCSNGRRCRGDVWEAKLDTRQKMDHPCPFPPFLPELALRGMGVGPTSLVLDPFCGIGSTGVAAKKLGAKFIGGDLSTTYLEIAKERLA